MNENKESSIGDLDAKLYKKHSDLQYKIAQTPLEDHQFVGNESILDIGCGDGRITAQLSLRVPRGEVIGIDKSTSMINFALQAFPKEEFPNLHFKKMDACSFEFNQQFDLITSFSCFHWIKNQKQALENIKKHLKSKGKAIIITFPRCSNFWDPIEYVAHGSKWKNFFKEDPTPYNFLNQEKYQALLREVDFKIEFIKTTSHITKFQGKEGFKNYVRGWLPFLISLPKELHTEFLNEIGDKSIELNPIEKDGFVYHPYEKIVMILKKAN